MRAVLFDIDGTLIRSGGAGRDALARGAARALGVPVAAAQAAAGAIDFRGRTDALLVEELCTRLGRAADGLHPEVVAAYLDELPTRLREVEVEVLPGVRPTLARLDAEGDTVVGLLTGNVRAAARIKLDACGLGHLAERPGGFGDDGRARADVARRGVERAVAAGADPRRIVVVGDTEHDVLAAHAAGAVAVAVATGWTPRETLRGCGAELFLDDLDDPGPLLRLLGTL